MSLKRRLDRLQRKTPEFYGDVTEIPTQVLDAMLRRAYRAGEWPKTDEEEIIFKQLLASGFEP